MAMRSVHFLAIALPNVDIGSADSRRRNVRSRTLNSGCGMFAFPCGAFANASHDSVSPN